LTLFLNELRLERRGWVLQAGRIFDLGTFCKLGRDV
jgi:hypothetical protein